MSRFIKADLHVTLSLNEIFIIICTTLFLVGTYVFTNRKAPFLWIGISLADILWILLSAGLELNFYYRILFTIVIILCMYFKVGIIFIADKKNNYMTYRLIGASYLAAGLLIIALILSLNFRFHHITPWLFLLNSVVTLIMAICALDVNFRRQLEKIKESESCSVSLLKAIKDQEEHYEKIIELMPDALFIHKGLVPVKANSAAYRLMRCDRNSSLGDHFSFHVHPNYSMNAAIRLEKLMESETTVPIIEEKLILKTGETIHVEVGGASYLHHGEMYIVTVARDISERKRNEKLQVEIMEKDHQLAMANEQDRLKTDYFTTISHELRTPLNIILGTIQMQMKLHEKSDACSSNASCVKYNKMMRQNCYRLLKLINNIIDLTKLDSDSMHLTLCQCDIVGAIKMITESVIDFASSFGITIVFHSEIEEKIIPCDLDKIERIILNLLSNAIKFTDREGLIEVKLRDRGDFLQISVKDTGIGIPEDKRQLIFERFGQVDSSFTRRREGSGIGLCLVKALVELQGGSIFLISEINRGSEFVFTLPARPCNQERICPEAFAKKDVNVEKLLIEFSDIYTS